MSSNNASYARNGTLPVEAPRPARSGSPRRSSRYRPDASRPTRRGRGGSARRPPRPGSASGCSITNTAASAPATVVRSDGRVGHYIGGEPSRKVTLLREEGIEVTGARIEPRRLEMVFRDFRTDRPLLQLREIQHALKQRVSLRGRLTMPGTVAGVDVSYRGGEGVAAYALWDAPRGPPGLVDDAPAAGPLSVHLQLPELSRAADPPGIDRARPRRWPDGGTGCRRRQRSPPSARSGDRLPFRSPRAGCGDRGLEEAALRQGRHGRDGAGRSEAGAHRRASPRRRGSGRRPAAGVRSLSPRDIASALAWRNGSSAACSLDAGCRSPSTGRIA